MEPIFGPILFGSMLKLFDPSEKFVVLCWSIEQNLFVIEKCLPYEDAVFDCYLANWLIKVYYCSCWVCPVKSAVVCS